ncbi:TerB family tellurite resistance protein [Paraflavitalea sp. CAU 1676]|uniref:TerB family tellurite resistance protein n=1 Tax=Paraflavitalea sp. CAU 1676 TaxID=3032598 RepID=UPI0023D9A6D1|nr:TerB family tellurite resistance protein [Paraflavitalea sp. CAU 1676]MDF2190507.1 TerB family tellurite resistance protein [Paraflavitalea sp. CAU 1676]
MKQLFARLCICMLLLSSLPNIVKAQNFELEQLILNIQKLNQLKEILSQMKDGYEILTKGYNTVKNLSESNFNLHNLFLSALWEASPTVKKYHKVVEIVNMQRKIVKSCRSLLFDSDLRLIFQQKELSYMKEVLKSILDRSVKNMEELLLVITAGKVRMNDAERLTAIDGVFERNARLLESVSTFIDRVKLMGMQRKNQLKENNTINKLYEYSK